MMYDLYDEPGGEYLLTRTRLVVASWRPYLASLFDGNETLMNMAGRHCRPPALRLVAQALTG